MGKVVTPLSEMNVDGNIAVHVPTLGFPMGLDLDRIGCHVTNLKKAAHIIGSSSLVITGYDGDKDEQSISGNLNPDGSMTNAKASTEQAERGKVGAVSTSPDVFNMMSLLMFNNTARKADMGEVSEQFSPRTQAESLNNMTKKQLRELAVGTDLKRGEFIDYLLDAGRLWMMQAVARSGGELTSGNVTDVASLGFVTGISVLRRTRESHETGLPPHSSVFDGFKADRFIAAATFISTHRFFSELG